MSDLATLVAPALSGRATTASPTTKSTATATAPTATALGAGEFYAPPIPPVQLTDSIVRVTGVFEINESETRRFPGHPDTAQLTKPDKLILHLSLARARVKISQIYSGPHSG